MSTISFVSLISIVVIAVVHGLDKNCPKSDGFFLNRENCHEFYICVKGVATLRRCPHPYHFNPIHTTCDAIGNSNCTIPTTTIPTTTTPTTTTPTTTTPTTTTPTTTTPTTTTPTTTTPTTTTPTTTTPTTTTAEPIVDICVEINGIYPNPKNCSTFYHCTQGMPHLKSCPGHLHFNPTLKVCDVRSKAGCALYRKGFK